VPVLPSSNSLIYQLPEYCTMFARKKKHLFSRFFCGGNCSLPPPPTLVGYFMRGRSWMQARYIVCSLKMSYRDVFVLITHLVSSHLSSCGAVRLAAVRARNVMQAWFVRAQVQARAVEDVTQEHVHGADPRHRQRARCERALPQDSCQRHHARAYLRPVHTDNLSKQRLTL